MEEFYPERLPPERERPTVDPPRKPVERAEFKRMMEEVLGQEMAGNGSQNLPKRVNSGE